MLGTFNEKNILLHGFMSGKCVISVLFCMVFSLQAQSTKSSDSWAFGMRNRLEGSSVHLSNWVAGGQNAISLNGYHLSYMRYKSSSLRWNTQLRLNYGVIRQEDAALQKTSDEISLLSQFGYDLLPNHRETLYSSVLLHFKTQFTRGYAKESEAVTSDFLAPAYLSLSLGLDYKPSAFFSFSYAPLGLKGTLVRNAQLAAAGAFGIKPTTDAEGLRLEVGTQVLGNYTQEFSERLSISSALLLFTNYQHDFGTIDVDWDNVLLFKLNEWLSTGLQVQLRYDKDIRTEAGEPARLQIKQVYGLNFVISLGTLPEDDKS